MATKKTARRKGNTISVDFTGVKSGGATIPDGRYTGKIIAVEQKEGKESGEPYLELTWEVTSQKCNGREVRFDNYSLQPQALWRLKGLLEAMEIEVLDGEQDIDFDEIISDETECIIEVTGEKNSEGKTFARVTGHAPLSDGNTVDDDEEEEEKPARRKPAKDEDEDDEPPKRRGKKDEDEEDEDEPPKRRGRPAKGEDEDDEEEEEDEKPPSKKVKKGAKVKFKDEKNKLTKGTIESIDGDTAVVVTADDETYEISVEELTVIG
jgi:Protein of unknown function (DUF669)